jgi:hypothetical protein
MKIKMKLLCSEKFRITLCGGDGLTNIILSENANKEIAKQEAIRKCESLCLMIQGAEVED